MSNLVAGKMGFLVAGDLSMFFLLLSQDKLCCDHQYIYIKSNDNFVFVIRKRA